MMTSIPMAVVYAGLGGTVLALIVATATNNWSPRVFFLLTLRLAIGWHFLFEGLHKVHSHYAGPTESSKPFSSEPYFKVAPGPLGAFMRKQFDDPAATIAARVKAPKDITPDAFARLSVEEQAAACPEAVAKELDAMREAAEKAIKAAAADALKTADETEKRAIEEATAAEERALKGAWTDAEKADIKARAEGRRKVARDAAADRRAGVQGRLAALQAGGREVIAAVRERPDGEAVAKQLEKILRAVAAEAEKNLAAPDEKAEKAIAGIDADEQRELKGGWSDKEKAELRESAEKARTGARKAAEEAREAARNKDAAAAKDAARLVTEAKAAYARWVYGVDGRDSKVKFMNSDVALAAPQRLAHLEWLRGQEKDAEGRTSAGLGTGYGYDTKKAAEVRTELITAEADLAKDATAFVAELKASLAGGKAPEEPAAAKSLGQRMDQITMWFLVAVGGCLMGGLLTRTACVLAAGFLVMTYLNHPPFPWYTQPPGTEGNPLFVNKNVIEALALLTVATFPTGRWLGLDALVSRVCCRPRRTPEPAQEAV